MVNCDHHYAVQALKDAGLDMRLLISRETFVSVADEEVSVFNSVHYLLLE